tara:strand:- start:2531 stop:2683 length:153 start_codon:yes stop_codon:yes gene_type:complete
MSHRANQELFEHYYENYYQDWKYANWITIMSMDHNQILRFFLDSLWETTE